jgi:hypothetical protein
VNFSTVTNFKITFFTRRKVTDMNLGTLRFIPLKEVFKNKYEELSHLIRSEDLIKSSEEEGLLFLRGSGTGAVECL